MNTKSSSSSFSSSSSNSESCAAAESSSSSPQDSLPDSMAPLANPFGVQQFNDSTFPSTQRLSAFTQATELHNIGHNRIAKLVGTFQPDLAKLNIPVPLPPDDNNPPVNGEYFDAVAALLRRPDLPESLISTLATIERGATPENANVLDSIIQRRLPCIALNPAFPLDCALEVFFACPDELTAFSPPLPNTSEDGVPAPAGPAIENRKSKIEIPECGSEPQIQNPKSKIENDSDELAFARLAALTAAQYDRVRKREARLLRIHIETLDAEVARVRSSIQNRNSNTENDGEPSAINSELSAILATLSVPEPWPEPVDLAEVLHQVAERYRTYVFLPPGAADAIALWTVHAHCFNAFRLSPRLNLQSPEPGCGKTTALDVIASMVPRAVRTENLTAPVLFRLVDQFQPTMLLDEVDSYLPQAEELRGLLNAGHKRGACAYRCAGEGNSLRAFKAFSPAVLSGIGSLPGTLHDRSIHIPLVKAQPGEVATPFNEENIDLERTLARKIARWCQDNIDALRNLASARPVAIGAEPSPHFEIEIPKSKFANLRMPPTAHNRLADNWRPLFAIAQLAGGDWPKRVADAFAQLTARDLNDTQSLGISLLQDIRQIFSSSGHARILSRNLVAALLALPESQWLDAYNRKPINESWLSRQLRPYGIIPKTLRVDDDRAKGYEVADFSDAFTRFLPKSQIA